MKNNIIIGSYVRVKGMVNLEVISSDDRDYAKSLSGKVFVVDDINLLRNYPVHLKDEPKFSWKESELEQISKLEYIKQKMEEAKNELANLTVDYEAVKWDEKVEVANLEVNIKHEVKQVSNIEEFKTQNYTFDADRTVKFYRKGNDIICEAKTSQGGGFGGVGVATLDSNDKFNYITGMQLAEAKAMIDLWTGRKKKIQRETYYRLGGK